jgi:hypothetical protein
MLFVIDNGTEDEAQEQMGTVMRYMFLLQVRSK